MTSPESTASALNTPPAPTQNLATAFQEVLTAIVRVRYRQQPVASADDFRNRVKTALSVAMRDARAMGYPDDDIQQAVFAVVAFVDECVLGARSSVFAGWQSLQAEMFQNTGHNAGIVFFEKLDRQIARPDSTQAADVTEVFLLCLGLGYKGRYGVSGGSGAGDLSAVVAGSRRKIVRIRGEQPEITPRWQLPSRVAATHSDPWLRHLFVLSVACSALAVSLFVLFKIILASTLSNFGFLLVPGGH